MLNDATGFKKVYLAAGYTDLRRGMEGLATIVRFRFHLDPYDKIHFFCSAVREPIVSKGFCGKEMVSCFFISVWITVPFAGRVLWEKLWKSHRNSTQCSCRGWRSLPDIPSSK